MHRPIQYTGSKDDCCPITCMPLTELRYPVSFRCASHQAYGCDDLLKWLQTKQTNPLTNLKVTWESSPLELIGPLAEITPTPSRVESKICFVLEGSGDAMAAAAPFGASTTKLWLGFHFSLFIIAISGIVSNKYSGFVLQCLVILFAGSHWYYDAKKNGRIKKLVLVVVAAVLLIGEYLVIIFLFHD